MEEIEKPVDRHEITKDQSEDMFDEWLEELDEELFEDIAYSTCKALGFDDEFCLDP